MTRTNFLLSVLVFVLLVCWAGADVKYSIEMQMGAGMPPMKSTVYVKGQMERRDTVMPGLGMEISTITQCGKKQTVTINWKCKVYYVSPLDEESDTPMPVAGPGRQERPRKGGVVMIDNEVRDTGERQTMFGMQARHVIAKMKMEAKEGACNPGRMEMENDMWLVNVPAQAECRPKLGEAPPPMPVMAGGCRDKYQMTNRGNAAAMQGLPVKTTMTMVMANGQRQNMVHEIKELSTAVLDPSVFEAPAGFRQASSAQEVHACGMGLGNIAEIMRGAERESRRAEAQAQEAQQAPAGAGTGGRRAGVWLIGVVLTDRSRRMDPTTTANQLVEKINAIEGFQGVRIDARAPADIQKEAVEKKCDSLLYGDVAEAKTSGPRMGGILGRAAGVGGSLDQKHSFRMDYRLTTVDPPDQQVAKDTLSHSGQGALEEASGNFLEKTAERATGDARAWKRQQR